MSLAEFERALQIFGLTGPATMAEVKRRHRQLAKKYHPDNGAAGDAAVMREISDAYRLLLDYCNKYRFRFDREAYLEQNPEERLREQFGEDPIWRGR